MFKIGESFKMQNIFDQWIHLIITDISDNWIETVEKHTGKKNEFSISYLNHMESKNKFIFITE